MADKSDPVAFDGACGLGAAFGRTEEADPSQTRTIDGRTVRFQSGAARLTSHLFTGRIRRAMASSRA